MNSSAGSLDCHTALADTLTESVGYTAPFLFYHSCLAVGFVAWLGILLKGSVPFCPTKPSP